MAVTVAEATPLVSGTGATSISTAAFTPPADERLVACMSLDSQATTPITSTCSDSLGGTWALVVEADNASVPGRSGASAVWVRTTLTTATSMTVTAGGAGGDAIGVQVYRVVGDGALVIGGTGIGGSTATQTQTPTVLTSTGTGGVLLLAATDWNATGTMTSTDLTEVGFNIPTRIAGMAGYETLGGPGPQTVQISTGGAAPELTWAAVEIIEQAPSGSSRSRRRWSRRAFPISRRTSIPGNVSTRSGSQPPTRPLARPPAWRAFASRVITAPDPGGLTPAAATHDVTHELTAAAVVGVNAAATHDLTVGLGGAAVRGALAGGTFPLTIGLAGAATRDVPAAGAHALTASFTADSEVGSGAAATHGLTLGLAGAAVRGALAAGTAPLTHTLTAAATRDVPAAAAQALTAAFTAAAAVASGATRVGRLTAAPAAGAALTAAAAGTGSHLTARAAGAPTLTGA